MSTRISASWDKTIKIWDSDTGICLNTLEGHSKEVRSIALTLDGRIIVSGFSDRSIKIWDAERGLCLKTLLGHSSCVNCVAISDDGSKIISVSSDIKSKCGIL